MVAKENDGKLAEGDTKGENLEENSKPVE